MRWSFCSSSSTAATRPDTSARCPFGFGLALFAAATSVLAQLPWYALPLLWVVPVLAARPLMAGAVLRTRLAAVTALAVAGALPFVLAAWFAARASSSVVS